VVAGELTNRKITHVDDLAWARDQADPDRADPDRATGLRR
jgi:hypothetical protein